MLTETIQDYVDVAPGERLVLLWSPWVRGATFFLFRRGGVPGISHPKGGHYYRHPKTFALLREAALDKAPCSMADDTLVDVPKLRQKLGRIPTLYDDVIPGRTRSWKKHRRTQWRPK